MKPEWIFSRALLNLLGLKSPPRSKSAKYPWLNLRKSIKAYCGLDVERLQNLFLFFKHSKYSKTHYSCLLQFQFFVKDVKVTDLDMLCFLTYLKSIVGVRGLYLDSLIFCSRSNILLGNLVDWAKVGSVSLVVEPKVLFTLYFWIVVSFFKTYNGGAVLGQRAMLESFGWSIFCERCQELGGADALLPVDKNERASLEELRVVFKDLESRRLAALQSGDLKLYDYLGSLSSVGK